MQARSVVAVFAATTLGCLTACSSAAAADIAVGDCLKMGGTPDRPEALKAVCGTPESNFTVVASVAETDECPTDVDSYYSTLSAFSDTSTVMCMDIDWVIGSCMSIDPENGRDPVRVRCDDATMPGRQRPTEILQGVADVDECDTGTGYPYDERNFTVCVEDVH
ncbi:hypothetical protein [Mycobacterium sp. 236(2023)]|uniref:LppU family putative lipoprotein n=1 Tax=Mycobacterium sp. 236(2023) TaxID=3038163 RepID=UPI002414EB39|nr:hypothetical protein [Mycobacterium sp. 236(2023)]MDG4665015.1 hypothetical protein [Mycobacterium sp. 236(2023)]